MVEHSTSKHEIAGSKPGGGAKFFFFFRHSLRRGAARFPRMCNSKYQKSFLSLKRRQTRLQPTHHDPRIVVVISRKQTYRFKYSCCCSSIRGTTRTLPSCCHPASTYGPCTEILFGKKFHHDHSPWRGEILFQRSLFPSETPVRVPSPNGRRGGFLNRHKEVKGNESSLLNLIDFTRMDYT